MNMFLVIATLIGPIVFFLPTGMLTLKLVLLGVQLTSLGIGFYLGVNE